MLCVWVHGWDPGYGMARGWHYTKLSLSSALLLYFSGMCFVFLLLFFVVSVLFLFCFVFMLTLQFCTGRCSSDIFLSSRPRTTTGLATTKNTGG